MNSNTEMYRVYNKCNYDIGVILTNGRDMNIKSGSFQLINADDILYIESICVKKKFFATKMLVAVGADGKEVPIDQIGIIKTEYDTEHLDNTEIEAYLKLAGKKFENWINSVDDPTELHAVYMIAKKMDLPASKLKLLKAKMPNKEWLED